MKHSFESKLELSLHKKGHCIGVPPGGIRTSPNKIGSANKKQGRGRTTLMSDTERKKKHEMRRTKKGVLVIKKEFINR